MTIHHTDSQSTPHLDLPYILPAQARKYISINESLTRLKSGWARQLILRIGLLSLRPPACLRMSAIVTNSK